MQLVDAHRYGDDILICEALRIFRAKGSSRCLEAGIEQARMNAIGIRAVRGLRRAQMTNRLAVAAPDFVDPAERGAELVAGIPELLVEIGARYHLRASRSNSVEVVRADRTGGGRFVQNSRRV